MGEKFIEMYPSSWFGYLLSCLENKTPNYDYDWYISDRGNRLNILLRFVNIPIVNSMGSSHIIPEIFFGIQCHIDRDISFWGTRRTFTTSEVTSDGGIKYVHSHTQTGCLKNSLFNRKSNFCTGDGPLSEFKERRTPNRESAMFILNLIDSYLKWESLEGTPWNEMSNLKGVNPINGFLGTINLDGRLLSNEIVFSLLNKNTVNVDGYLDYLVTSQLYQIGDNYYNDVEKLSPGDFEILSKNFDHYVKDFPPLYFRGIFIPFKLIQNNDVSKTTVPNVFEREKIREYLSTRFKTWLHQSSICKTNLHTRV